VKEGHALFEATGVVVVYYGYTGRGYYGHPDARGYARGYYRGRHPY
jgi:hypothetical protein